MAESVEQVVARVVDVARVRHASDATAAGLREDVVVRGVDSVDRIDERVGAAAAGVGWRCAAVLLVGDVLEG